MEIYRSGKKHYRMIDTEPFIHASRFPLCKHFVVALYVFMVLYFMQSIIFLLYLTGEADDKSKVL